MRKKVLIIISCILFMMIIALVGWFVFARQINEKEQNSEEQVFFCNQKDAKKAMLIYQGSNTVFSRDVAKSIAINLSENGYDVVMNHPGSYLPADLSEYDLVVFGSPIYMASISTVIEKYINRVESFGNAIVVFIVQECWIPQKNLRL